MEVFEPSVQSLNRRTDFSSCYRLYGQVISDLNTWLEANIDLNEKWNLISIHEGFTREKQLQALQNMS